MVLIIHFVYVHLEPLFGEAKVKVQVVSYVGSLAHTVQGGGAGDGKRITSEPN